MMENGVVVASYTWTIPYVWLLLVELVRLVFTCTLYPDS